MNYNIFKETYSEMRNEALFDTKKGDEYGNKILYQTSGLGLDLAELKDYLRNKILLTACPGGRIRPHVQSYCPSVSEKCSRRGKQTSVQTSGSRRAMPVSNEIFASAM